MKCPNCNHENRDSAKFCEECGNKLQPQKKCCPNPNCINHSVPNLPLDSKFCPDCGSKLNIDNFHHLDHTNLEDGDQIEINVNGVKFNMIWVNPGSFRMGAANRDEEAEDDERPSHRVTLTKGFFIGETPVTQELWTEVMEDNPSDDGEFDHPVWNVSWLDCQVFAEKISGLTGRRFRLPTEAEWEFAAKGGNKSENYKYSGSNDIDDVAWYTDNSDYDSHPVAELVSNELGIFDMCGSVEEWCADSYDEYQSRSVVDPCVNEEDASTRRITRGGSYGSEDYECRITRRNCYDEDEASDAVGIRLVLDY